ncbi:hypothetical protein LCGC14_3102320 [marine sediment metagenome]|uniref:Uncharacterized protein n=1 Tax=marine sediment metagenome TaxID=412755 RepID=A0A0F8W7C1_9ZZZZ
MPKQLETFGHQGHLGGWITSHVQGKTIDRLEKDGLRLYICTTDGHRYPIGWQDIHGNELKGEPFLERLDVNIVLTGAGLTGTAGNT